MNLQVWGSTSLGDCWIEHLGPGMLRNITREFSCPDLWSKTLIYIDEFRLELEEDFDEKIQNFESEFDDVGNDVDAFVAVSPWVGDETYEKYNVALHPQFFIIKIPNAYGIH